MKILRYKNKSIGIIDENGKRKFLGADIVGDLEANGVEVYKGEYEVIPSVLEQTLETKDKYLTKNVTVTTIPFSKVSNTSGGNTVTIGVAPVDTNGETLILKL